MKRYDSYKDSGVEWIGEFPNGWKKSKVKYHFHLISGFPFSSEDITNEEREYPIIRIGNVTSGKTDVYFEGELSEKHPLVNYGDYVVSLTGDFSIRKWENKSSLLNQRCGLIKKFTSDDERFLFYYLPFQFRILEKTKYFTTLKNLSNGELLDIEFIVPPLSEQRQIVSFLDTKTSLIDSLIEKTQRKIELLKEKRTSLINEVVTTGLNPNVEMKDSGVEWIGEIPSHWDKTKPKYQFFISGGGTPSKDNSEYWDGDIPWVSPKDMKLKYISKTEDYVTTEGINNSSTKLILQKSLLMVVRSGILQHTIPVCFNSVPVTINQDLKSFEEKGKMSCNYFYYFIKGHKSNKGFFILFIEGLRKRFQE